MTLKIREFPLERLDGLSAKQTVTTLGAWIRQLDELAEGLRASIEDLQAQLPLTEERRVSLIRRRDKLRHLQVERDELEGMLEVQVQHMPRPQLSGTVAQRFMAAALELLPPTTLEAIERRAGLSGL